MAADDRPIEGAYRRIRLSAISDISRSALHVQETRRAINSADASISMKPAITSNQIVALVASVCSEHRARV